MASRLLPFSTYWTISLALVLFRSRLAYFLKRFQLRGVDPHRSLDDFCAQHALDMFRPLVPTLLVTSSYDFMVRVFLGYFTIQVLGPDTVDTWFRYASLVVISLPSS